MLDHVTIGVRDLERAKAFYDGALRPLGVERLYADREAFAGYGVDGKAFFWIGLRAEVTTGVHVAFAAADRGAVDAFYRAALGAGGLDNGAPGLRPRYHNIEAVCRAAG
jgi:catechol 2,3-dioxygenase-like lactoylglutathione lyase family enzyme